MEMVNKITQEEVKEVLKDTKELKEIHQLIERGYYDENFIYKNITYRIETHFCDKLPDKDAPNRKEEVLKCIKNIMRYYRKKL